MNLNFFNTDRGGRMAGCSLHDAFPDKKKQSSRHSARTEERRKTKGPALSFLKASDENQVLDPDRLFQTALPPAEKLGQGFPDQISRSLKEGFLAEPDEAMKEIANSLVNQHVDDVIGQKARSTLPDPKKLRVVDAVSSGDGEDIPSYFGKSDKEETSYGLLQGRGDDTEGYADYSSMKHDNPGYILQKDFMKQSETFSKTHALHTRRRKGRDVVFQGHGQGDREDTGPRASRPSLLHRRTGPQYNTYRPPAQHRPAYAIYGSNGIEGFENQEEEAEAEPYTNAKRTPGLSRSDRDVIMKKLDLLFARMEGFETIRNENTNTEITMFIICGLFLLFSLETLRKFQ